jgi:hypothetical protein
MIEIRFVVVKNGSLYYAGADWRPKFSANREDADLFGSYEQAEKILREGAGETESPWFPDGYYTVEKWFIVKDTN